MKRFLLLMALASCSPAPDVELECTPIYFEEGVTELPCNTPETVYAADDILTERYGEGVADDVVCTPIRVYPSWNPPQASIRGRYAGVAHPYVGVEEVHLRLMGPDFSKTALYHEYFQHLLPLALEGDINAEHKEPWTELFDDLTEEIFRERDGYLHKTWCTTNP